MNKLTSDQEDDIKEIAQATRYAIKRLDRSNHESCVRIRELLQGSRTELDVSFPTKWCKFASCVLGRRIARLTKRPDIVLCKWDSNGADHWWLRIDRVDIDITVDQFEFTENPVVVQHSSKLHAENFPNEDSEPLFANSLMRIEFERAILELDFALSKDKQCSSFDLGYLCDRHAEMQEGLLS